MFLFAGGKSSRIWPLSAIGDKSLLPATNGKPIIRNIVDGISESSPYTPGAITILCNSRDLSRFQHEFRDKPVYFNSSQTQLGTVGHLIKTINQTVPDNQYLIHYADMVINDINYDMLDSFHHNKVTIVTTKVRGEYGVIDVQGNKVINFFEKPIVSTPTWTGIMLMDYDDEVRTVINDVYSMSLESDIGRDLIPEFVKRGWVDAMNVDGWIDVGTASKYLKYISP